jgi:hypothetical protein
LTGSVARSARKGRLAQQQPATRDVAGEDARDRWRDV